MSEQSLLLLGIGEGVAIIIMAVALLVFQYWDRMDLMDWAGCFEKVCHEKVEELGLAAHTLVEVATSLRINRKETTEAVKKLADEVPSRTAAEVDRTLTERAKTNGGSH